MERFSTSLCLTLTEKQLSNGSLSGVHANKFIIQKHISPKQIQYCEKDSILFLLLLWRNHFLDHVQKRKKTCPILLTIQKAKYFTS